MRSSIVILSSLLLAIITSATYSSGGDPTVRELLEQVGIKPQGDQRGQMDTVGFVTTAGQMDAVMGQCLALAASQWKALLERHDWSEETSFIAAAIPSPP